MAGLETLEAIAAFRWERTLCKILFLLVPLGGKARVGVLLPIVATLRGMTC